MSALVDGGGAMFAMGKGDGAGDGGVLSCIDGTGALSKGAAGVSSVMGGSDLNAVSLVLSGGLGDSTVEMGGGSIMGVVLIKEEGGTGKAEESCTDVGCVSGSLLGEGLVSFISVRFEFTCAPWECKTIVGGSSALAKRGSVTQALCRGVEDNKCSLLACIIASLPIGVDKEETEWPLGSFLCSDLRECISMKTGADTSPVKSTAEDAVDSIVDTAVAAASCSGVSPTPTLAYSLLLSSWPSKRCCSPGFQRSGCRV